MLADPYGDIHPTFAFHDRAIISANVDVKTKICRNKFMKDAMKFKDIRDILQIK